MAWRVARSLDVLLSQLNERAPKRSKRSDGSIGDAAHASRDSDHNPWVKDGATGIVTARDFTHDPSKGADMETFVEELRASRDVRIKYVIWNRRMFSSYAGRGKPAWTWRAYKGANPHTKHAHVSVQPEKRLYDDDRAWALVGGQPSEPGEETDMPITDAEFERFRDIAREEAEKVGLRVVRALLKAQAGEDISWTDGLPEDAHVKYSNKKVLEELAKRPNGG